MRPDGGNSPLKPKSHSVVTGPSPVVSPTIKNTEADALKKEVSELKALVSALESKLKEKRSRNWRIKSSNSSMRVL